MIYFILFSRISQFDCISNEISESKKWQKTIISLVREVVSSVDPNVRKGDSLDIKPYVKLKIIPGDDESHDNETSYINDTYHQSYNYDDDDDDELQDCKIFLKSFKLCKKKFKNFFCFHASTLKFFSL